MPNTEKLNHSSYKDITASHILRRFGVECAPKDVMQVLEKDPFLKSIVQIVAESMMNNFLLYRCNAYKEICEQELWGIESATRPKFKAHARHEEPPAEHPEHPSTQILKKELSELSKDLAGIIHEQNQTSEEIDKLVEAGLFEWKDVEGTKEKQALADKVNERFKTSQENTKRIKQQMIKKNLQIETLSSELEQHYEETIREEERSIDKTSLRELPSLQQLGFKLS